MTASKWSGSGNATTTSWRLGSAAMTSAYGSSLGTKLRSGNASRICGLAASFSSASALRSQTSMLPMRPRRCNWNSEGRI